MKKEGIELRGWRLERDWQNLQNQLQQPACTSLSQRGNFAVVLQRLQTCKGYLFYASLAVLQNVISFKLELHESKDILLASDNEGSQFTNTSVVI
jgi:hypothetical protein